MSLLTNTARKTVSRGNPSQRSGLPTAAGVAAMTVLTSLPVFLPGAANGLISSELGWSSARMGAVLATYWLGSLAGAFFSKHTEVSPSAERTLAAALGATCVGLLAAALAPTWGLWVSSGVGGVAYGYSQPHTNALLMRWCAPRLRAFAFGLKQAAVPAATLLASVAMPALAQPAGWRPAFALTAALCGVTGCLVTWKGRRGGRRQERGDRRSRSLPKDSFLLTLSAVGFCGALVGNGLGGFLLLSLTTKGVSLAVASAVTTASAAANILVRLGAGWLAGRAPQAAYPALAALFATGAAGTLLLTASATPVAALGALLAYSGGWGWAGLLHYVIGLPYPGQEQQATAYSQMGVSLGAAAGPMLCGLLFTLSSNAAWMTLSAAGILAAVLTAVGHGRASPRPERANGYDAMEPRSGVAA